MPQPGKKEETVTIPKYEEVMKNREETIRLNLAKCMEAPQLERSLQNGFFEDNKELFYEIRSQKGRRRDFAHYFMDPYNRQSS
tara:strand:- start:130 stop:378 length:249 start_codon:yes stop_codon:yes gene_type:complete